MQNTSQRPEYPLYFFPDFFPGSRIVFISFLKSLFRLGRDQRIDRRIARLRAQGTSATWSNMTAEERARFINCKAAETRAIERMLRLRY